MAAYTVNISGTVSEAGLVVGFFRHGGVLRSNGVIVTEKYYSDVTDVNGDFSVALPVAAEGSVRYTCRIGNSTAIECLPSREMGDQDIVTWIEIDEAVVVGDRMQIITDTLV